MKEFVEKLIERLEEEKQRLLNLKNDTIALSDSEVIAIEEKAYNFCKEIVNQLAEEYVPDTNVGKWIPCSERLPDEIGRYIVTLKDGRSLEGIYDNISKKFIMYGNEVVAWMPMPQPYKQEQQKEIPTNYYTERFNRVM